MSTLEICFIHKNYYYLIPVAFTQALWQAHTEDMVTCLFVGPSGSWIHNSEFMNTNQTQGWDTLRHTLIFSHYLKLYFKHITLISTMILSGGPVFVNTGIMVGSGKASFTCTYSMWSICTLIRGANDRRRFRRFGKQWGKWKLLENMFSGFSSVNVRCFVV